MRFSAALLSVCIASAGAFAPKALFQRTSTAQNVAVGDSVPSVELLQGFPDPKSIDVAEYTKGKKTIIVGLPGAFTPTCSATQVPGYLEAQDDLKDAGIDEVLVYCVNDPAVMQAWSIDQKTVGSMVTMMADASGAFTEALDLKMTHPGPPSVGIIGRSKRFALYVDDGEVKYVAVSEAEDDPAGDAAPEASCAPGMLEAIKDL